MTERGLAASSHRPGALNSHGQTKIEVLQPGNFEKEKRELKVISTFFFGLNTLISLPMSNIHANKNVGLCQGSASLHTLSSPSQT